MKAMCPFRATMYRGQTPTCSCIQLQELSPSTTMTAGKWAIRIQPLERVLLGQGWKIFLLKGGFRMEISVYKRGGMPPKKKIMPPRRLNHTAARRQQQRQSGQQANFASHFRQPRCGRAYLSPHRRIMPEGKKIQSSNFS